MNILDFHNLSKFGMFGADELKEILQNQSDNYRAEDFAPNGIIIKRKGSNHLVSNMGCVCQYFTDDEKGKRMKSLSSTAGFHRCGQIQGRLGTQASGNRCTECLRLCINQFELGSIYKVIK